MIRDLSSIAALAAVGGALSLSACSGDGLADPDDTATPASGCPTAGCPTAGCPTAGCPTAGCPTSGCPTSGCPTSGCPTSGCPTAGCPTSGWDPSYATSPDFFTAMAGPASSGSVHGVVQIWYTTDLMSAVQGNGAPFTAPVGATAIKEADNGTASLFVMTKQAPGFDAANGDWLYETRDLTGAVTSSGALSGCIACHALSAATDYLAGTTLR